jgi:hypothetical protein
MMLIVKAVIHTEAPLSVAMPVPEGGRANAYGQFPVMARGMDEDGNLLETGYLPATTIRGFLRRAVVVEDMQKAAAAGSPYRLPQAYAELIGQDSASEQASDDIDLLAIKKQREENPVLDLFGSGMGMKSRLRVSHFLPEKNVLPQVHRFSGVRKDLNDTEAAFDALDPQDNETFTVRARANNRRAGAQAVATSLSRKIRAAARKGEDTTALKEELAAAQALVDKHEAEMGDMRNSSRTLVQHWALPAGLDLHGKFVVEKVRGRDIELLVRGLEALSADPSIGRAAGSRRRRDQRKF